MALLSTTNNYLQNPIILDTAPHGTEIITVGYKDGFIICADKRSQDNVRGHLDTDTKITQLNNNAAFTSSGMPILFKGRDLNTRLFDADQITKDFLKNKSASEIDDSLKLLGSRFVSEFKYYLLSRPNTAWPETRKVANLSSLFDITLFYRKSAKEIKIISLYLIYEKKTKPVVDLYIHDSSQSRLRESGLNILAELLSGAIKDFNSDRSNPIIRTVLFNKDHAELISFTEGLKFAKEVIRIAHTKGNLIPGMEGYSIGPTCDCALITYQKGFSWQGKNINLLTP